MRMIMVKFNTIKKLLPIVLLAASSVLSAQSRFELGIRGGANMLMYKSDYGKMAPSYNFGVDLLYSYRSPNVVGFRGGVAVDFSQSVFKMQNYADQYSCIDYSPVGTSFAGVGGDRMDVEYSFQSVSEAHNQIYASVPLQLSLNFGNFSIFMGPKIAIPLRSTFKQELTGGKASVTYNEYDVTVDAYHPVYNSGKEAINYVSYEGEITKTAGLKKYVDINIMASVDINYYIPISKTSSFGIGLYCDYGLPLYPNNAVVKFKDGDLWRTSLMWLEDPTDKTCPTMKHSHNSVLEANLVNGKTEYSNNLQLITRTNYLSCGIRLSYNIGGVRKEVHKHWYKDLKKCQCVFTN